jgi:hypothetical protein
MNVTAAQIVEKLGPGCRDSARRSLLLGQTVLNGIDFIEFEIIPGAPDRYVLHVHFLLDLPVGAYGLPLNLTKLFVHGGTRIIGVTVIKAASSGADPKVLDVDVDQQGDFSRYLLTIDWTRDAAGAWQYTFNDLDRLFSVGAINFRPGCPIDFDCAPVTDCPPEVLPEPALDYLARDYASFRQLLLDLVAQRNPTWIERSPADLGIALLELFSHEGDHLSYFQDAVANEAFLDTARQRVSAKRHAKLVDYQMHDGRNAWGFVHLQVGTAGTIGPGQQLVTRIDMPMRFDRQPGVVPVPQPVAPPGTRLNLVTDLDYRIDPALAQVRVFETTVTANLDPLNNELRLHTWGNEECCLPRGATIAHVYAIDPAGPTAVRPPLKVNDYLVLEEVLGPDTGAAADADPRHRTVVRIESVNPDPSTSTVGPAADQMHDKLFLADIDPLTNAPKRVTVPVPLAQTLPLVEVRWRKADALTFALCLTAKLKDGTKVSRISVARGNVALADHGRTIRNPDATGNLTLELYDFKPPLAGERTFRLRLAEGPLTMQCQPNGDPTIFPPVRERPDLTCDVAGTQPAVAIQAMSKGVVIGSWWPVPDLLSSTEFQHQFVADVDDTGRPVLRFGDGEYGERFTGIDHIEVWYRIGNGRSGNIGADSLAHIVVPDPVPPGWPTILKLRNPLPAIGGVDPELIEQVRQYAPAAFRATQFRAVTEQDYKQAALTIKGVAGAVASFRWTGSWYTVFVGIDPADSENVLTNARGFTRLEPNFKQQVLDGLSRYRLAGYDLEIRSARYIPLDLTIQICAKPGYFRGDVAHAVALALSAGVNPGGSLGLFNPANLTFAQNVYLSRIYAAVEDVEGVESATVSIFRRHGRAPAGELESGVLPIGAWEIARLDNDPSNMENGTLTITAGGGL